MSLIYDKCFFFDALIPHYFNLFKKKNGLRAELVVKTTHSEMKTRDVQLGAVHVLGLGIIRF